MIESGTGAGATAGAEGETTPGLRWKFCLPALRLGLGLRRGLELQLRYVHVLGLSNGIGLELECKLGLKLGLLLGLTPGLSPEVRLGLGLSLVL